LDLLERPQCADCSAVAPETKSDVTLISTTGWRLERRRQGATVSLHWRCPTCWRAFKAKVAHA
jgi:hypothetical protein